MQRVLTAASSSFEAARQVDALPDGHRCRRKHGHSFRASVHAELPSAMVDFPGGEVAFLRNRIESVTSDLDYCDLNARLEQPTDENLARWVQARLDLPGIQRLAVQSTRDQGVDLDHFGTAHVWRRYRFQAAHQLPNVPEGHKCGRMHGHGFEVIVHANQDLESRALSIDYDYIDSLWKPIHAELDYRCLNDVPGLSNPTSEIIASWIWSRLAPVLAELSWITVYETASCGAHFDGDSYRIWKDFTFDSAVRISRAPISSKFRSMHGHTFTLRLHLAAPIDQLLGWTVDFGDVKEIFDPVFRSIDHRPLFELPELADTDTASIAAWIYQQAHRKLPQLARLDLFETEGCGACVTTGIGVPALPL